LWGLNVFEIGRYNDVLSFKDLQQLNPELTAAIIVEAPMREIGGAMPSWDELVKMRAWCKEHNINMHLDGARIWQSTVFYERSLADIAALFDSLYLSFYKDLGGIFGAALLGPPKLLEQARIWSRRAGGNPITMYPEVIAARAGLEKYLVQMPELVTYTVQLVTKLRANGIKVIPDEPQAAMFHIEFTVDAESLTRRIVSYAEKTGILVLPMPRSGDKTSCICEVAVGDQAIAYEPEFWCKHINDCLA
jgi:threonine aldolase